MSSGAAGGAAPAPRSVVELCFDEEDEEEEEGGHKCGYCGGRSGSVSVGMWAHALTPEVYQHLINHGWRRSGKYVYRPRNEVTCCPMYTIRCDAERFQMTKSMKKVVRRVNNFVWDNNSGCSSDKVEEDNSSSSSVDGVGSSVGVEREVVRPGGVSVRETAPTVPPGQQEEGEQASDADSVAAASSSSSSVPTAAASAAPASASKKQSPKSKCKRKPPKDNTEKTLSDLLRSHPSLEISRVLVGTPEFVSGAEEEHALYVAYQVAVHNDNPADVSFKQFKRFLVDSPIIATPPYGTYHVRYYTRTATPCSSSGPPHRTLIGVGVVDILPQCMSSVYFFYDPRGRSKLSLGTYGALQEIQMVREIHEEEHLSIMWYYMGFYIHSCSKMRYKGKFAPSQLLCDKTHTWVDIGDVTSELDKQKYVVFNKEGVVEGSSGQVHHQDVSKVQIMTETSGGMTLLRFGSYNKDRALLQRFADLVGSSEILPQIIVYRSSS